ncbi:hypothetical protein IAQ67_14290 [Paenibacillus peoriae]|uniref:Uncharacterized protein n=1 Tax=Paenibacillus peoriae TaxID=59893 RepID=A0A7H0Y1Y8_9BACL|nr:hypothetical protein [Paenibacillus peoriae]QNR65096.1 hypothetical protein IAQ67_14290 [Paenibacillus peoriae]
MLTIERLEMKGFLRTVYEDEQGKPEYYTREFLDPIVVETLHTYLGESTGEFDFNLEGIYCVLEINAELTSGQYLFAEKDYDNGFMVQDPLSPEEFERLLDII